MEAETTTSTPKKRPSADLSAAGEVGDVGADGVVSPTKIPRTAATTSIEDAVVRAAMLHAATAESIRLTGPEERLFEFLLDVEKQYDCKAVLRVAGGWVRDKLLGRHSDDIDIVLDTMTGKDFADLINAYEDDHGHKQHPVGIIKANPEQSKHLETATMHLGDEVGWVDFVNLRAETYSDEHRIPVVEFGTPIQDAERRDFTINSLFYNISARRIEDFTERGLRDLRDGLIRTPLDPRVTFLDDPLRVLRAVRFASRFNFALDEDLQHAAQSDDVKEALIKKVSRERVGKELLGMLTGSAAHPERALKLLHDLGLCRAVFLPPLDHPVLGPDGVPFDHSHQGDVWNRGYAYAAAMYSLVESRSSGAPLEVSKLNEDEQNALKLRILAAFLLPLAEHYVIIKKRQHWLPGVIIRDSLKLRNRDAEDVATSILSHVTALQEHVSATTAGCFDRVRVGLLLRTIGPLWPLCSDVALIQDLVDNDGSPSSLSHEATRRRYATFAEAVRAHGLDGVWEMKPLLNGNELIKVLGVKPGPAVKEMLDHVLVWQLEHPDATHDACLEHFRGHNL